MLFDIPTRGSRGTGRTEPGEKALDRVYVLVLADLCARFMQSKELNKLFVASILDHSNCFPGDVRQSLRELFISLSRDIFAFTQFLLVVSDFGLL